MATERVLVLGSAGQIGTDLVSQLRKTLGTENVVASDVKDQQGELKEGGTFMMIDVLDTKKIQETISMYEVTQVYHLAALLSAVAEQKVKSAWKLNMEGLLNVLEIAKERPGLKVFWPSSIAVFGPTTPRENTPQTTIMEPTTVYGVSKLAGERWCEYYFKRYSVDVRSLRFPGLISYKSTPGGGTTDYAVDIFHHALERGLYTCYLRQDTILPMMYMPDAIKAITQLMSAEARQITIRSSYNVSGMSFNPGELADEIRKYIPEFKCNYQPDFRQQIADSWPQSIDDRCAREQWNWQPEYDISKMTDDMISHMTAINKRQPVNSHF